MAVNVASGFNAARIGNVEEEWVAEALAVVEPNTEAGADVPKDEDPKADGGRGAPNAEDVEAAPKAEGLEVAPKAEGPEVAPKAEGVEVDPNDGVDVEPNADGAACDPKADGLDCDPNADAGVLVEPNADPEPPPKVVLEPNADGPGAADPNADAVVRAAEPKLEDEPKALCCAPPATAPNAEPDAPPNADGRALAALPKADVLPNAEEGAVDDPNAEGDAKDDVCPKPDPLRAAAPPCGCSNLQLLPYAHRPCRKNLHTVMVST